MSEGQALIVVLMALAVIWVAIMWASSRIAGWSDLARVYRAAGPFDGTRWLWQFIALRYYWGYGLVTVGANSRGLYLALLAAGEWQGHRPLFIPWSEVSVREPGRMKAFYQAELRFRRAPDVPIRIKSSLAARLDSVNPEFRSS